MHWYRLAAEQNNAYAQCNLGDCYELGHGVEQESRQALYWYRLAAEQDNMTAKFSLATMLEAGKGMEKNEAEAIRLYQEYARAGFRLAQQLLKERGISWE